MKRPLKSEKLFAELEDVACRLFGEVREEQGLFQTGVCILHGKTILLVNKRQSIDERIAALAREISRIGTERLYLKPAVRAEIERYSSVDVHSGMN
ncbi:hypothetical protein HQ587_04135 [bacterium]|nr:hypothetical protein [bacterium]